MAFFAFALLIGMLLTPQRKLILNKALAIALLITTLIFLPNIIWQYQHHWPFITHMHKLEKQQLDYLKPADFIVQQFLVHALLTVVWLTGFAALLLYRRLRPYRFLAAAYLLVFAFLLLMHGKSYYLFGAYPMLFAAGGYTLERMISFRLPGVRVAVTIVLLLPGVVLLPMVLPILPLSAAIWLFGFTQQHLPFLSFVTRWEDGKTHKTTQDYADMLSWEEMTQKVAVIYHRLPVSEQATTVIFTDNYGEAAAIHHFHKQYQIPDVTSLNSSFALWAPAELTASNIIYVSDDADINDLIPLSEAQVRADSITNPLAREYGTVLFLVKHPKPGLAKVYHEHWQIEQQQ